MRRAVFLFLMVVPVAVSAQLTPGAQQIMPAIGVQFATQTLLRATVPIDFCGYPLSPQQAPCDHEAANPVVTEISLDPGLYTGLGVAWTNVDADEDLDALAPVDATVGPVTVALPATTQAVIDSENLSAFNGPITVPMPTAPGAGAQCQWLGDQDLVDLPQLLGQLGVDGGGKEVGLLRYGGAHGTRLGLGCGWLW